MVHLARRAEAPAPLSDPDRFERLVKFAFTRRRKQMGSILKEFGADPELQTLDLSRRPETVSLEEWAEISERA